jgi:hypothetical protein
MKALNEKLAEEPQEVAEFRAKCIAAVERCDDPDIIEAMVCIKRLYEASQTENERLTRVVGAFENLITCENASYATLRVDGKNVTRLAMRYYDGDDEVWESVNEIDDPDLFAQLKGADRG